MNHSEVGLAQSRISNMDAEVRHTLGFLDGIKIDNIGRKRTISFCTDFTLVSHSPASL
jgi:hypothetical protein